MRASVISGILLVLVAHGMSNRAVAQDPRWAQKMFEKLDHDFGTVPSDADLKYRIKITNIYKEQVVIGNVQSSCGCTAGKPSKTVLNSEETAWLEITMDTRRFRQLKETKVFVDFTAPLPTRVEVAVRAFINPDLVLRPGALEFGSIEKGVDQHLKMSLVYSGRGATIKEAVCKNPHVTTKLTLIRQEPFALTYELIATIKKSAPLGEMRDQVTLVTTDPNNPQIPVLLEARVDPEFIVTPEIVSFGNLLPGERKTINIVVRSKKPFAIAKIESEKTAGTFETRIPSDARQVHVLPLTMVAPKEAGAVADEFTVTIAGSTEPVTFKANGKVR
ncbi:MAG: DUF1573 domain-containing protein [Planctomycetes bacterium]|nr:DUF1573 domain-containing protein [Planctomycetota bacterium]